MSALFVGGMFTLSAFAQNGQIESIAKKALKDAGCIGSGNYNAEIVVQRTCLTNLGVEKTYYQVDVYNPSTPGAPVGRVYLCGTDVQATECL